MALGDGGRPPLRQRPTIPAEHEQPVGERPDVVDAMLDDDHGRRAASLEGGQALQEGRSGGRVEVRGRLVEHQERRIGCQGARQGEALALAARERGGHGTRTIREADVGQCLRDSFAHRLERPPPRFEAEGDVVLDAFHDQLPVGILEDDATVAVADLHRAGHRPWDITTEEADQAEGKGALA